MSDSKDTSLPHGAAGEARVRVLYAVPSLWLKKVQQIKFFGVALNKSFLEIRRSTWRRFAENCMLGSLSVACVESVSNYRRK